MEFDLDPGHETQAFDTVVILPSGMTGADIARACRESALEFVADSKFWGKAELVTWLGATHTNITRHASKSPASKAAVPLLRDLDERLIHRILKSAREEIVDTLARVATDGAATFVLRALITGTVARCEDSRHEPTWAPTGEPARLADRVLSLFAVDYLLRPGDYESYLSVCCVCETVTFDAHARGCDHGLRPSLVAGRRRSTLPYPPLGA